MEREPLFERQIAGLAWARNRTEDPHIINEPEVPVYVQEPGLDPVMIFARLYWSVAEFKQSVKLRLWFKCSAQVISFKGKKMQNEKSLAFYGVREGATMELMEKLNHGQSIGAPGGRWLFSHGLTVSPGPTIDARPSCCPPYVRFEMLTCDDLLPHDEPIGVELSVPPLDCACVGQMESYAYHEESILYVICADQLVVNQSLVGGGEFCLMPDDGWQPGTEYTVLVRNCQGRGVGWTFRTKFIEK